MGEGRTSHLCVIARWWAFPKPPEQEVGIIQQTKSNMNPFQAFFSKLFDAIDDGIEKYRAKRYKLADFDQELFDGIEEYLGKLKGRDAKWIETHNPVELQEVKDWAIKHLKEKDRTALDLVIDRAASELKEAKGKKEVRTPFMLYRTVQMLDKEHYFKHGKTPADFVDDGGDDSDTDTELVHKANAYLFVADLDKNQTLNQQWTSLLQNIQDQFGDDTSDDVYLEKYNIVQNFLVNEGYNTTPDLVLDQLQVGWYEDYVAQFAPNADSDRFVQELLGDSSLLAGWQAAIAAEMNGQEGAADDFLTQRGYNCTKEQVDQSFLKMRDHTLSFWAGIYGNVVYTPGTSDSTSDAASPSTGIPGEIITIYSDREFGIGGDVIDWQLCNVAYDQGILTWDTDSFGTQVTEGKLTFSQVTRQSVNDPYVGSEFFGTITYTQDKPVGTHTYSGTYNVFGRIGKPQASSTASGPIQTPPKVALSEVDKVFKYFGYMVMIGFAIQMIYGAGKVLGPGAKKAWSKLKDKLTKDKSKAGEDLDDQVDMASQDAADEIAMREAPNQLQPADNGAPGNNEIGDVEGLPPAEAVDQMEEAADQVNEEGEMDQGEDSVAENADAAENSADATGEDAMTFFEEFVESGA